MGKLKSWMVKLSVLAVSLLTVLILVEVVLSILHINSKSITRFVPGKGITYLPKAYYRHTKEGFSEGYINSHGFRDHERTYRKMPNTYRIMVLGDSFVEGLQLPLQQTFTALLETKLNHTSDSLRFEVLNLGHSGFGTADEYMRYVNFGTRYEHDMVILALFLGNDIRNNSKLLNFKAPAYYFDLDDEGNLVLDRSLVDRYAEDLGPTRKAFQWLKRRSYLVSLVSEKAFLVRRGIREQSVTSELGDYSEDGGASPSLFADENIYLTDMRVEWVEAFEVTKKTLLLIQERVEQQGAEFLLVSLGSAEMVHPELQVILNRDSGTQLDFAQPHLIFHEWADATGVTHLGLTPISLEYHKKTGKYLHGFRGGIEGHWNAEGHERAAHEVSLFLIEHQLVPAE